MFIVLYSPQNFARASGPVQFKPMFLGANLQKGISLPAGQEVCCTL